MGKWNLDILYTGFDTVEYQNDLKRLEELLPELSRVADSINELSDAELITKYIKVHEELSELVEKLAIYANLRYSANTRDTEAASMLGRIMQSMSATAAPAAIIEKAISEIDDLDKVIKSTPALADFEYMITKIKPTDERLDSLNDMIAANLICANEEKDKLN